MSARLHQTSSGGSPARLRVGGIAGRLALLSLVVGFGPGMRGQESWLPLEGFAEESGWVVRGGARALFNVKASMSPVSSPVQPGVYDDGFVLPDISGSADGRTWYWGYDQDSQLSGQLIRLSRLSDVPAAGSVSDETGDGLNPGGEVIVGLKLAELTSGPRPLQFGIECGYGFNRFTFSHSATRSGTARLDSAAYDLGGTVAPPAPYAGTFEGPGPLINLSPSISGTLLSPAEATYSGEWESSLHTFKFGLWLTYPLSRRFSSALSLGYASVLADTQVTYQDSVSFQSPAIPDVPLQNQTVGGDREWKPGVYADLRLAYELSPRVGIYAAGQFQANDSVSFQEAGREYKLDLGTVLAVTLGVTYRF